jgi:transcriptional regulator with XRE-family HTH domain
MGSVGLVLLPSTISKIESGHRTITLNEAVLIAAALGLTVDQMLSGAATPCPTVPLGYVVLTPKQVHAMRTMLQLDTED